MRAEGISHDFDGLVALDDVSLEARRGELLVLLGANGSGKSTLLAVAAGLLAPRRGRVVTGGRTRADRMRRVGYCPQRSLVFSDLTAHEQLALAGRAYGLSRGAAAARASALLARLGLDDKAASTPGELSGGMLRRLNLAFALVHQPELLLLDEPSAGLDRAAQERLHESLAEERAREATVVLASHDLREVEALADRVAVLDRGRLIALDTPRALLARLDRRATVEIELADGADEATRLELTGKLAPYAPRFRGATLELSTEDVTRSLADVVARIASTQARPRSIVSRTGTLADVYAHLTGRSLTP